MDLSYLITPFVTWFVAGSLKFLVNTLRARQAAFAQIGYGGLPSNHSAIVSAMVVLIALRVGISSPAFGVALTLAFIVMLDANSLRRQVGLQAQRINQLKQDDKPLRERMGHSAVEIGAGIVVGALVAWVINSLLPES